MHNKPAGCGASEAYASGPDGEEEEVPIYPVKTQDFPRKDNMSTCLVRGCQSIPITINDTVIPHSNKAEYREVHHKYY